MIAMAALVVVGLALRFFCRPPGADDDGSPQRNLLEVKCLGPDVDDAAPLKEEISADQTAKRVA